MSHLEINLSEFPKAIADALEVGAVKHLLVTGQICRIEDDLIPVPTFDAPTAVIPGERHVELLVTDVVTVGNSCPHGVVDSRWCRVCTEAAHCEVKPE